MLGSFGAIHCTSLTIVLGRNRYKVGLDNKHVRGSTELGNAEIIRGSFEAVSVNYPITRKWQLLERNGPDFELLGLRRYIYNVGGNFDLRSLETIWVILCTFSK